MRNVAKKQNDNGKQRVKEKLLIAIPISKDYLEPLIGIIPNMLRTDLIIVLMIAIVLIYFRE